MAVGIIPRFVRGRLFFQVSDVLFPTFPQAATAWSAANAHRLGIADEIEALVVERNAALATMKASIRDEATFSAASRREAELTAQIRRHKRHRNGRALPLTADDQYIFQRATVCQEYDYRRADSDDAEIVRLRLTRGGIVANVKAGVRS